MQVSIDYNIIIVLMQANKEGRIEYIQEDWYNVSSSA